MSNLYIVIHPGMEPDVYKKGNICCKNTSSKHKRKFMEHKGDYIDESGKKHENQLLRFWGEYECCSYYQSLGKQVAPYYDNPNYCHKPIAPISLTVGLNTDPFIFGDEFYYACCKKTNKTNLQYGDIILFGTIFKSQPNKSKFELHLDTFFVVDKEEIPANMSAFYIMCMGNYMPIRVHKGILHKNNQQMFSFVPCRPRNNKNDRFGRLRIDLSSFGITITNTRNPKPTTIKVSSTGVNEFNNIVAPS